MARGLSGRIVVEIDPELKLELYTALTSRGLTLKAWFTQEAAHYIRRHRQPFLFSAMETTDGGDASSSASKKS